MMSGYRIRNFLPALAAGLLLAGCNMLDEHAPAAPRGLYSVTGDGRVTLHWLENTERDLDGYVVYYSLEGATGPYHKLEFTREIRRQRFPPAEDFQIRRAFPSRFQQKPPGSRCGLHDRNGARFK